MIAHQPDRIVTLYFNTLFYYFDISYSFKFFSTITNRLDPPKEGSSGCRPPVRHLGAFPPMAGGMGGEEEADIDSTGHVFLVNNASLFLFQTTMKQLVNALLGGPRPAAAATDDNGDVVSGDNNKRDGNVPVTLSTPLLLSPLPLLSYVADGGRLQFDVFDERLLNVLNSVYTKILANYSMSKLEASAMTDGEKKSSKSSSSLLPFNNTYRLFGSVFLTPHNILLRCDKCRFECKMMDSWRGMQRQPCAGAGSGLGWEFRFLVPISGTPIVSGNPIPFLIPKIPVGIFLLKFRCLESQKIGILIPKFGIRVIILCV
jgi:hypothetical protein